MSYCKMNKAKFGKSAVTSPLIAKNCRTIFQIRANKSREDWKISFSWNLNSSLSFFSAKKYNHSMFLYRRDPSPWIMTGYNTCLVNLIVELKPPTLCFSAHKEPRQFYALHCFFIIPATGFFNCHLFRYFIISNFQKMKI